MHFFPPESDAVIRVSALTRRFGATTALDSVNLSLPRGAVYGLVGANGAGKTTLIKHILGRLKAERGSVRVAELMRYSRALYPAWDDRYAEEVKQVADHVTMINHGKILLSAPLPDIKARGMADAVRLHGHGAPLGRHANGRRLANRL